MATVTLGEPLLGRVSWGAILAGFFFGLGIRTPRFRPVAGETEPLPSHVAPSPHRA